MGNMTKYTVPFLGLVILTMIFCTLSFAKSDFEQACDDAKATLKSLHEKQIAILKKPGGVLQTDLEKLIPATEKIKYGKAKRDKAEGVFYYTISSWEGQSGFSIMARANFDDDPTLHTFTIDENGKLEAYDNDFNDNLLRGD